MKDRREKEETQLSQLELSLIKSSVCSPPPLAAINHKQRGSYCWARAEHRVWMTKESGSTSKSSAEKVDRHGRSLRLLPTQ